MQNSKQKFERKRQLSPTKVARPRRAADEQIRLNEERFAALLRHNPSLLFLKDENGRYVYLNPAYEKQYAMAADWLGKTDFDFWPRESAELFRRNDAKVLESGEVCQFLEDSLDLNGCRHCWLCYKFPFTDVQGKKYVGGIGIDSTQQVLAEEALRQSEEKYRTLFETMGEGFCICELIRDENGRPIDLVLLDLNAAFEKQTGHSREGLTGRRLSQLLAPPDFQRWIEFYARVVDTAQSAINENGVERFGRWYGVSAYPSGDDQLLLFFRDITERKRAEEILRERENWLRGQREALELAVNGLALEKSLGVLVRTATEGLGQDVQAAFYLANDERTLLRHVVGMPAEYDEAVDALKIGPASPACGLAAYTGQPIITPDVTKDAHWKPCLSLAERFNYRGCWSFPIHSAEGMFVGALAVYSPQPREATEHDLELASLLTHTASIIISRHLEAEGRKKAELTLLESEQRYREIVETAGEGIAVHESDGTISFVNQRMADMLGYSGEDIIGRSALDFVPEDAMDMVLKIREDLERKGVFTREQKLRKKDGSILWTLANIAPLRDGTGKFIGFLAMHTDITEGKLAEEALQESRRVHAFQSAVLKSVHDPLWATDSGLRIVYWNDAATASFGWTPEEVRGLHTGELFRMLIPGSTRDDVVAQLLRTGDYHSEVVCRCKDGRSFLAEARCYMVRGPDGEVLRVVGTTRDITERKRAEEALITTKNELEIRVEKRTAELVKQAAQLRALAGELTLAEQRERQQLANVLHDGLQQILVGAKFRLSSASRSEDIQSSLHQVSELIDDAIETSRSLTAELSPTVLLQGDLVSALEWLARWMQNKHDLDVTLTARREIELLTHDVLLLLFQAVRELLFNVVKHAGVKSARVIVNRRGQKLWIAVEDEGIGFELKRLRSKGGLAGGIGLFSISERLSHMGGQLKIESSPGRGSRFKLSIPYAPANSITNELDRKNRLSVVIPSHSKTVSSDGKRIRIVLVDDHLVMRQGLAGLLRLESDFEIVGEASDGVAAIELVRELRPDVILMDVNMPGMDGIEATRIIHQELPGIRVIGLSMFPANEQAVPMREAGAVDYVTKSGPSGTVIDAIRKCVRSRISQ